MMATNKPSNTKAKRAKPSFERIILFARQYRANQNINETLQRLVVYFQARKVTTLIDEATSQCFNVEIPTISQQEIGKKQDLIVVVGGDGSLLSAARMAVSVNVPVIGINRGRLGFLTDISPNDFEHQLDMVLAGNYTEEDRSLLQMKVHSKQHVYYHGLALNDIVLSRGTETHLIDFDVYIDQQFVSHYRSDGLILATPTGSTAYALSAGGPIMHPQLDATVMVPMFSHSLSSRPLVIDGHAHIELRISSNNERELQISCDGQESCLIKPGHQIAVKKHRRPLRLLHPNHYQYYDMLRIKLGWGVSP